MYLIILGEVEVYQNMKEEIYPILRNASLYNRNQPLATRGTDFFKNNKYTSIATFEEKAKIKSIGCKYIIFCLECVYVLSQWLPTEPANKNEPSLFRKSYENLIKDGVTFPNEDQFILFEQQRIKQIQQQIKQCQQQLQKAHSMIDQNYFQSMRSKQDIQMMNGVEYLQKRLKQKDRIISDLKSNHSANDINRQSMIQRQKQQEMTYINKIQIYQERIAELTQQVRNVKILLRQTDSQQLKKHLETIRELQLQNNRLMEQNQLLRDQLLRNSSINSTSSIQKPKSISSKYISPRQKQIHCLKQLMQIETQPNEFQIKSKKVIKQQFFSYQQARQCFMPFIDTYSKQQIIRLKKSILKTKQVLFKNRQLQIGVITILQNQIEVVLVVILTNLTEKPIIIHQITYDYPKDIQIKGIWQSRVSKKKLKPGQQLKEEVRVIVNNIDSRCVLMVIEYQEQGRKSEKMALILPISKFKLVRILNYTSHPRDWMQIQRIFAYQKKILNNLDKMKDYFPKCYLETGQTEKTYNLKCELLQTIIFMSLSMMGEQSMRILIRFNNENRCLGQKLLNQLLFILSK